MSIANMYCFIVAIGLFCIVKQTSDYTENVLKKRGGVQCAWVFLAYAMKLYKFI